MIHSSAALGLGDLAGDEEGGEVALLEGGVELGVDGYHQPVGDASLRAGVGIGSELDALSPHKSKTLCLWGMFST